MRETGGLEARAGGSQTRKGAKLCGRGGPRYLPSRSYLRRCLRSLMRASLGNSNNFNCPPALLTSRVSICRQRMADKNRVGSLGIQTSIPEAAANFIIQFDGFRSFVLHRLSPHPIRKLLSCCEPAKEIAKPVAGLR